PALRRADDVHRQVRRRGLRHRREGEAGLRRREAPHRQGPLGEDERVRLTTLVTGIAGGLAQRVATFLLGEGEEVFGVDYRPVGGVTEYPVFRASYNKTAIEDVFRKVAPKRVLHLGRIGNLSEPID